MSYTPNIYPPQQRIHPIKADLIFNGEAEIISDNLQIEKTYPDATFMRRFKDFKKDARIEDYQRLLKLLFDASGDNRDLFVNSFAFSRPPPPPMCNMKIPFTSSERLNSYIRTMNADKSNPQSIENLRGFMKDLHNEHFDPEKDEDFDGLFGLFLVCPFGSEQTMRKMAKWIADICPATDAQLRSYLLIRESPKLARNLLIFLSILYKDGIFPRLSTRIPIRNSFLKDIIQNLPESISSYLKSNYDKLYQVFDMPSNNI